MVDNIRDRILLKKKIPVAPRMHEGLLQSVLNTSDAESQLLFDANHAVKKLRRWKELMPRVKPFFGIFKFVLIDFVFRFMLLFFLAIKCNPDPVLIKSLVLSDQCGFDCASIGEICSVLEAGAHPGRIIYANPNKAPEAILKG